MKVCDPRLSCGLCAYVLLDRGGSVDRYNNVPSGPNGPIPMQITANCDLISSDPSHLYLCVCVCVEALQLISERAWTHVTVLCDRCRCRCVVKKYVISAAEFICLVLLPAYRAYTGCSRHVPVFVNVSDSDNLLLTFLVCKRQTLEKCPDLIFRDVHV